MGNSGTWTRHGSSLLAIRHAKESRAHTVRRLAAPRSRARTRAVRFAARTPSDVEAGEHAVPGQGEEVSRGGGGEEEHMARWHQ